MKTAKDLIIPFSWAERRPILLDRFFYVPSCYPHTRQIFPFFECERPLAIEYCSGNGEWIGQKAKQFPQMNWLAVEKRFERARKIWLRSHRENLSNLWVACSEGFIFTRYYAPKAAEVFINFPDPWPKRRHAKHRLIQLPFLAELWNVIDEKGKVTCVTDDALYADQILGEFEKCSGWKLFSQKQEWPNYGRSYFSDLWEKKGRTIYYLYYEAASKTS